MSYDTNKTFAYYHHGKVFHVYRISRSVARGIDTSGVIKEYGISNVLYPDETITNGIRIEYTALEDPFVIESPESSNIRASGITFSFSGNVISDSAYGFTFASGDRIRIQGSTSNDGFYTLTSVNGVDGTITDSSTSFVIELAGASITITQVPKGVSSPTELTHLNLNRMLSLAIVDYVKASMAERDGNLEQKEYYMRQFSKKVSDNNSNKNKMYIIQSTSYSVK